MARYAIFTVTLSEAPTEAVTVSYATKDGTATAAAGDYTPKTGTLTFAPGETSKQVSVTVRSSDDGKQEGVFTLVLSQPANGTIGDGVGDCVLPGASASLPKYVERFNLVYDALHNTANGYFGPQTGANAFAVPRHIPEIDSDIINEAPDYGGETVSETASFWVGLEAVKGKLSGDWTGYMNAWAKIEQFYIPSAVNQPVGAYTNADPADYIPEQNLPSLYPPTTDLDAPVGVDPLSQELETTYGNKRIYLMHWIIDVEGKYGFKNGDGSDKIVFMNTYQRGMQESSYETVPQACWDNFQNGGGPYGFQPLFTQGKPVYPEAPFDYGKKWSYTNAPDAEARSIQWAFRALRWAQEDGKTATITTATDKAKKMGDYLRYNLFDKYFRKIGQPDQGTDWTDSYGSCHFLINWYASWGGEIPAQAGQPGTWSYRIGCSEVHHGYQGVDAAYAMAEGGGGMKPLSPSAGDIWKGSVYRQIEMIRWLQSPEGPIAGGVTNSWNARYETPTDGRQNAKFYGMNYTYSPVWHDPLSNNWVGFQSWGHGRTAHLFMEVADKTTPLANEIRPNLEIILDRLVAWFMREIVLNEDGTFTVPGNLSWANSTPVAGQTATAPNHEGVYEYIPSLNWDGTGDYGAFWNASNVPNPNLHCRVTDRGVDLGVASSTAVMLLFYAQAKRLMGKFDAFIPNTSYTAAQAFSLAKELIDRMWAMAWDTKGITLDEPRADYSRMNDPVYVPPIYDGAMPNGDAINGSSTFVSIRSFLKSDPKWADVQAYAAGTGPVPVFKYHRFWANAEYAIACGTLHTYFADTEPVALPVSDPSPIV